MAGPLPVNQIKTVINKVRIFASRPAPRLDETVEATRSFFNYKLDGERPYVQGSELAKWLRGYLSIPGSRRIDPLDILKDRGVDARGFDFELRSLDGIAGRGARHGPGVLLRGALNGLRRGQSVTRRP